MTELRCHDVRDLIPELALGVAPGPERAAALEHIATCADCSEELRVAAQASDELLLLAPAVEPPSGFESRVMAALEGSRRRPRRALVLALAASALVIAGLAGGGVAHWLGSADRHLADQYRTTLQTADGTALRSADLTMTSGPSVGSDGGQVFGYDGQPSWVFMTVGGVPSQRYRVQLVEDDGTVTDIGICRVRDGYESWGTVVDVPLTSVDRVVMRGAGVTFTGHLD